MDSFYKPGPQLKSGSPKESDFLVHILYLISLNLVIPRDLVLLVTAQQLIFFLGTFRKCFSISFHLTFPEMFILCNLMVSGTNAGLTVEENQEKTI